MLFFKMQKEYNLFGQLEVGDTFTDDNPNFVYLKIPATINIDRFKPNAIELHDFRYAKFDDNTKVHRKDFDMIPRG